MQRTDFIYELQDVIAEHSITFEQAFYCMCLLHNIEYEINASEVIPLYQKGLIKNNKVNNKVLFRSREEPKQAELELTFDSTPKASEKSLKIAHKLEAKLVIAKYLTEEYREEIAQKFFKGDKTIARYFIIFKSIFPVRDKKLNSAWNKHYGYVYDDSSRWDSHVRVAKKFHEYYRKKDIGLFIAGTYLYSRDVIDPDNETCYMTKPYKFLNTYEQWYEEAQSEMERQVETTPENAKKYPTKGSNVV